MSCCANARFRNVIALVFIDCIGVAYASGFRGSQVLPAISDRKGSLYVGQFFSDTKEVVVQTGFMRATSGHDFGVLTWTKGQCRIGDELIAPNHITISMNGREFISLAEARSGFQTKILIRNPDAKSGLLRCAGLSLESRGTNQATEIEMMD